MTGLRPWAALSGTEAAAARQVIDAAAASDGVHPVSEQTLLRLSGGGGTWILAYEGDAVAGLTFIEDGSAEIVVHPDFRRHGIGSALLSAVDDHAGSDIGIWAHGRLPAADAFAESHSYVADRVLLQMGRTLSEPLPEIDLPADVSVRTFVPGQDDAAWLQVNRRAFAHHPEQGSWTRADLRERFEQRWFDPAGFFLAFENDRLLGFHWTKIHDPATGEIYVIAVDPDAQGRRLGPALAVIGLRYLQDRGCTRAILYVEEAQRSVVRLYERLGFATIKADVQFRRRSR